jgi:hypothetical protein
LVFEFGLVGVLFDVIASICTPQAAAEQRAIEAESKLKQEAANCVAQTARLLQAQGKGQ